MVQGKSGAMYMGGPGGITVFDGSRSWKIDTEDPVLALAYDSISGSIYVGCRNSFGYIQKDIYGQEIYKALSTPEMAVNDAQQIIIRKKVICFFSDNMVYKYRRLSNEPGTHVKIQGGSFAGAFVHQNDVFVNVKDAGIYILTKSRLIQSPVSNLKSHYILFSFSYAGQTIVGLSNNQLYSFNGKKITPFSVEDENGLSHWLFSDAILLSQDKMALATVSAGCLVISLRTGKTLHRINYFTGLPDDEIFALGKDREGGLWMAHIEGFSRADSRVPIRVFSHYPGLEGNIISVLESSHQLYAATNEGLYFLSQTNQKQKTFLRLPKVNIGWKKDKTRLARSYKKKGEKQNSIRPDESRPGMVADYEFRPIPGVIGKCRSLFRIKEKIYLATNTGLYEIKDLKPLPIIKDVYINLVTVSSAGKIFLSTREGIISAETKKYIWKGGETGSLASFNNELWIESAGKIHRLTLNGNSKPSEKIFSLLKNNSGEIEIRIIENEVLFINDKSILRYNRTTEKLEKLKDHELSRSPEILTSQESITWYKTDSCWTGLSSRSKNRFINRFALVNNSIERIFLNNDNLWIVNNSNELIRIHRPEEQKKNSAFDIDISTISADKGVKAIIDAPELPYNSRSLTFQLCAPHFLAAEGVQIQYKLTDVMTEWSDWNKGSELQFPILPSGDHTLLVRAKNSIGEISETRTINFSVSPPYWRTGWFYLLEILFFGTMIFLSIMLNANKQNIFYTKALTFLTLIILMEFLHEVIKSVWMKQDFESPVISFLLDVMLACLISPIEKFMEIYVLKRRRQYYVIMIYSRRFYSAAKGYMHRLKNVEMRS
jgi:hypothetical protein